MKADAGRRNCRKFGEGRRWWRLRLFDEHRFIALRLAALVAESRIGGELCSACANVRHASSVSRYAEGCDVPHRDPPGNPRRHSGRRRAHPAHRAANASFEFAQLRSRSGCDNILQVRKHAEGRRVQDPGRVEFHLFDFRSRSRAWRGGVFLRQSRAGGGNRGAIAGHSGNARDASGCSPLKGGSDPGEGCAHRYIRPVPRGSRGRRQEAGGGNRSHAGPALRSSLDHRRPRNSRT